MLVSVAMRRQQNKKSGSNHLVYVIAAVDHIRIVWQNGSPG